MDYSVETTLSSTNYGFALVIGGTESNDGHYFIRTGTYHQGAKETVIAETSETTQHGATYSKNSDLPVKMEYVNGTAKLYIDNTLYQTGTPSFYPKYLKLWAWHSQKTITYSTIKIKSL